MNRRTLLKRGGIGVAALGTFSGCTEETLEEAETNPTFMDNVSEEEIDLPVDQRIEVVEDGILRAEDAEIEDTDGLEAYLEEEGLSVEDLSEEEKVVEELPEIEIEDVDVITNDEHGELPVLSLEYVRPDAIETGALDDMGVVAGGYAALVDAGPDAELLEATVVDSNREPFGSFDVLTPWAEEYVEGTITAREYGHKVWMTAMSE